jgi:hypothetical protein
MPIHFENSLTLKYKNLIKRKFNFLLDFFNFEPGKIYIKILPLDEFEKTYKLEKKKKPAKFVVGSALSNWRIIILDKEDFDKKGYDKKEFGNVILHELCHIFLRRFFYPKHTYAWIEEGLCQFLSFGKYPVKITKTISFKKLKTRRGWQKYNAYPQAKEFFSYLAKAYGKEKILSLLAEIKKSSEEKAFKKVFGKRLENIEKDFFAYLKMKTKKEK